MFTVDNLASRWAIKTLRPVAVAGLLCISACSQKTTQNDVLVIEEVEITKASDAELAAPRFEQGIKALSQQDYSSARMIFMELISRYPGLAGPYMNLALIEYNLGNFADSQQLVDKVIEINQQMAQAYNLRAQLRLKQDKISAAREDYLQAISISPAYKTAHYNLALLYDIYLQDIEQAIRHYQVYLELEETADERTRDWLSHLKSTLTNAQ